MVKRSRKTERYCLWNQIDEIPFVGNGGTEQN